MRRTWFIVVFAFALVAAACRGGGDEGGGGGGASGAGPVEILLWHGFGTAQGEPDAEWQSLLDRVDEFNASHPNTHVTSIRCCTNDKALQKVTVALQGDEAPDITYQYGSSLAQLAAAPGLLDLTEWTPRPPGPRRDLIPP